MASFEKIYPAIRKEEGGYSNNPSDKGKETYAGISRRYNPQWEGWKVVSQKPRKNGEIIQELEPLVKAFYRDKWNAMSGNQINNDGAALSIFDFYFNAEENAIKTLQRYLNTRGNSLNVDGAIGPKTLDSINRISPDELVAGLTMKRIQYYQKLAENDFSQQTFLHGWIQRASNILKAAEEYISPGSLIVMTVLFIIGLFFLIRKK